MDQFISLGLAKMLIPKKNRVIIYESLFKHGVMVAKKDLNCPKHCELDNVPNLQVVNAMKVSNFKDDFLAEACNCPSHGDYVGLIFLKIAVNEM